MVEEVEVVVAAAEYASSSVAVIGCFYSLVATIFEWAFEGV